ncbi:RNA 2',3'-cyclic phosphodiesterase [Halomonas shantousis]
MRLFFALWPDAALRGQFDTLAQAAHDVCGGRLTRPQTRHLTLAFLGEVAAADVAPLVALTRSLPVMPGQWRLDRLGYFPRGGVVWAGSREPSPDLDALHAKLHQALAARALAPRVEESFIAHVTLLRHARRPQPGSLPPLPLTWRYSHLELVHSVPDGSRRRYETLARSVDATP